MDSKICVLGLGYIGLPTASILAVHGFWVVGVDVNPEVVETVNDGSPHIVEPGLETLVKAATYSGHLVAKTSPEPSDVFVIAVPTPIEESKEPDLSAVVAASEAIFPYLRQGNLVILESTVPPSTTVDLVVPILERSGLKAGVDFQVAHAPERVLPGNIMSELVQNDRIIGGINEESAERARELYRKIVSGTIYLTDSTTAELVKLVENTFRDVNIALANELALISSKLDIDVWEVIKLANKHPRVNVLQPGPGVGGHCIPVDPWFIVDRLPGEAKIISLARNANDQMPHHVYNEIMELLTGIPEPRVAVMGLAYKANVGDTRESPSHTIIDCLKESGCSVSLHDPFVMPEISVEETLTGADCLVLLVDHQEYEKLDPIMAAKEMRRKLIYVARQFVAQAAWEEAGFRVKQLGNGASSSAASELVQREASSL